MVDREIERNNERGKGSNRNRREEVNGAAAESKRGKRNARVYARMHCLALQLCSAVWSYLQVEHCAVESVQDLLLLIALCVQADRDISHVH